jgi:hypothetical protein
VKTNLTTNSNRLRDRPIRTQVAIERTAAGKYRTSPATGDVAKVVSPQLADAFGTTSQGFVDASMSNLLTFFASHQREVTSRGSATSRGVKADETPGTSDLEGGIKWLSVPAVQELIA